MRGLDPTDAAITGLGWATSLGFGVATTWAGLRAGARGVRVLEGPEAPAGCRLGAPVERPLLRLAVPEDQEAQAKFLNGAGELAATVVGEAVRDAGLLQSSVPPERRSLYVAQFDLERAQCRDYRAPVLEATANGTRPLEAEALNKAALHTLNPFVLLQTLHNNAFSFLAAAFSLRGPNTTVSGWEGAGLAAVGLAARSLRTGRADAAIAAGSALLTPGPARLEALRLGLTSPSADPASAARPFDRRRDGMVLGDGAAAVVLEPLAVAGTRLSGPIAVVAGQGGATGTPPPGALSPDAETLAAAARSALRDAGLRASELLAVVASGSGRRVEDRLLLEALADVLGGAPVPIVATAGSLGCSASGGDVGHVVVATLLLRDGLLPPTVGFEAPEPGFEGLRVLRAPEGGTGAAVLVLSAGLDGQAYGLVLARVR